MTITSSISRSSTTSTAQGGAAQDYLAYNPCPTSFAIRICGDSLRPRIKSGEYVVAEHSISAQPGDDVVVKRRDGKVLVKELLVILDDEILLGSVNNEIQPITMPLSEIESIHRVAAIVASL